MKRIFGYILMLVLAVAFFAGCKGSQTLPPLSEIDDMSFEEIEKALEKKTRDEISEAWGEPDGMLSGLYGDIYYFEDNEKMIIIYYDKDSVVESIKLDSRS